VKGCNVGGGETSVFVYQKQISSLCMLDRQNNSKNVTITSILFTLTAYASCHMLILSNQIHIGLLLKHGVCKRPFHNFSNSSYGSVFSKEEGKRSYYIINIGYNLLNISLMFQVTLIALGETIEIAFHHFYWILSMRRTLSINDKQPWYISVTPDLKVSIATIDRVLTE
jgi:hypothetical protein